MEEWKTIEDSDGYYLISNYGRMKRLNYSFIDKRGHSQTRVEKYYDPIYNKKNGYYSYKYRGKTGDSKSEYVHRLVASHFVANTNINYAEINHIDGNKSNNHYTNLEWVDRKLNMEHASATKLINTNSYKRIESCLKNRKRAVEMSKKKVVQYNLDGELMHIYNSYAEVGFTDCANRLTYKGNVYRDYDLLLEKYNCIPNKISTTELKSLLNTKRKIYISYCDGVEKRYSSLKQITDVRREEVYRSYNHNVEDKYGRLWKIINT